MGCRLETPHRQACEIWTCAVDMFKSPKFNTHDKKKHFSWAPLCLIGIQSTSLKMGWWKVEICNFMNLKRRFKRIMNPNILSGLTLFYGSCSDIELVIVTQNKKLGLIVIHDSTPVCWVNTRYNVLLFPLSNRASLPSLHIDMDYPQSWLP